MLTRLDHIKHSTRDDSPWEQALKLPHFAARCTKAQGQFNMFECFGTAAWQRQARRGEFRTSDFPAECEARVCSPRSEHESVTSRESKSELHLESNQAVELFIWMLSDVSVISPTTVHYVFGSQGLTMAPCGSSQNWKSSETGVLNLRI